jgi:hypothetical protein
VFLISKYKLLFSIFVSIKEKFKMRYQNIREEELKNKVGQDFFSNFDTTKIVGNIDFCVTHKNKNTKQSLVFENDSLLWAEAKKGTVDMLTMMTQLVLTIGKARTFDKFLPPAFLGAFDSQKIGFVPYNAIMDVFSMNDFNWNVTPSNHETKEFKLIKERIEKSFQKNHYVYDFLKDEKELKQFIKNNVGFATQDAKIAIDKNNFVSIYLRWLEVIKPIIDLDWESVKNKIFDREFYLADLFVDDKGTSNIDDDTPLSENIFVVFKNGHYEILNKNLGGMFTSGSNTFAIKDKNIYEQFWKKYKRPPLEKFQQYILERKDLLVSQDIRERRGAFFTPQKWVALSQQYIADVLGEDWQDEYYIWDCAAGTGNLLAGLTNEYNIWASTLEMADVNVMHERIDNGAKLLKTHCFQFDFLNDDFSKLPQGLQDIINNEEKRKKLVIYINPPYAEHGNRTTISASGEHKTSVANKSKVYDDFSKNVGTAARELFAQFYLRVYKEIPEAKLASFSTLKLINSQNFIKFRQYFKAHFLNGFICKANSFDNVNGNFPICFLIWDLSIKKNIEKISTNIILEDNNIEETVKTFYCFNSKDFISGWLRKFYDKENEHIGYLVLPGIDMQQQNGVYLTLQPTESDIKQHKTTKITKNNLFIMVSYLAIRHCIEHTWINHNDQFLFPNDGWQTDNEFQNDCLVFALFHNKNIIMSNKNLNQWIPFTEQEVNAKEKFESNFMTQFIKGKIKQQQAVDLFATARQEESHNKPLEFSEKATNVFNTGRELWKYYHKQPNVNVNASLYDIREYFQGRNEAGKMNNKSHDETYMKLITELRESLKILAKKIEPKVYEYGFLKI